MKGASRSHREHRHASILLEVRTSASVRISDLARDLGVSGETIRRDLAELTQEGLIQRTYGGATMSMATHEPMLAERGLLLIEQRTRIARRTAELVQDGQVILIDGGSTTTHVAASLAACRRNLTVITNATGIASLTGVNTSFRVMLCPGLYDPLEGSVLGVESIDFLSRYNADIAIFGASGATTDGPCDANADAVAFKRVMIRQSSQTMLVVDASKFGQRHVGQVCSWDQINCVITDTQPNSAIRSVLNARDTSLLIAGG
ncbi:MAG: DeoR/GlpR family DNA-binding transcription regulator [Thermomicrobiales bacterium]